MCAIHDSLVRCPRGFEREVMFYRQKILLALIEAFGGRVNRLDLQKYLFLFTQTCQQERSYDFVPYKYGCFSFQSYADRKNLTALRHLTSEDDWQLSNSGHLGTIDESDGQKIVSFQKHYKGLSGDSLVREVYRRYPYYAINSEMAARLLSSRELANIEAARPKADDYCFFTIGYEGSSFENYLNRLIQNNVKMLCDVRKNPISRKYGFSKLTLADTLNKLGIAYVHIPALGIVSEKRQSLNSQADYDRLLDEYERTTLLKGASDFTALYKLFREHRRVAITCFEAQPHMCHRGRVAKALEALPGWGYPIQHI